MGFWTVGHKAHINKKQKNIAIERKSRQHFLQNMAKKIMSVKDLESIVKRGQVSSE